MLDMSDAVTALTFLGASSDFDGGKVWCQGLNTVEVHTLLKLK